MRKVLSLIVKMVEEGMKEETKLRDEAMEYFVWKLMDIS